VDDDRTPQMPTRLIKQAVGGMMIDPSRRHPEPIALYVFV
jgi:hypothetical protein